MDPRTFSLAVALADSATRQRAAEDLARHAGATSLLVFAEDRELGAFLPAPGFPQTLPGGAAWRALLARLHTEGVHAGDVGYPTAEALVPATACVASGIALVFVGGPCDAAVVETVVALAPLLASAFRAEYAASAARGELKVAQQHAQQAETLAIALDAARAEVERTLLTLEKQTQSLDEARVRAEEAAVAKDEFLAMLGHELRNPMSPILTALQLMRLKGLDSREQDVIDRQVANLMRLVDDLLDVSRITRGKIELRQERVELAEVAARAIELSSPVLEKKRQVLAVEIPSRGLMLNADPSRLSQILANLLTNAAKYSDEESRVVFAAERAGDRVRIRVKDEGIGIGPDMLARVFDLFVQQRQSVDRSQGGLGLGLAIVRSLVELHGGTVRAHSQGEGRGSEFVVELPLASGQRRDATPPDAAVAATPSRAGSRERVLIVDDNEDARVLLSEALSSLGYVVRTAGDGPGALRLAQEFAPQVALLDIGLPVMDGYELAERLRDSTPAHSLCLIAVTGYGQSADRARALDVGFDAHVVKPLTLERLQQVLDQLHTRRKSPAP
jgi:signal transduction histidine kinase/ActR/RegA family two-component response regulator